MTRSPGKSTLKPADDPFTWKEYVQYVLSDRATGETLRYGELRCAYDVCLLCYWNEPIATVQGKRGGWYHLHPVGGSLTPRQCALLDSIDADVFRNTGRFLDRESLCGVARIGDTCNACGRSNWREKDHPDVCRHCHSITKTFDDGGRMTSPSSTTVPNTLVNWT